MSGTFWRSAVLSLSLLAAGIVPAMAQSSTNYASNCRTTIENSSTKIICNDNLQSLFPKPGPVGREDVVYSKPPEPMPVRNASNFCGHGFRLAGDGTCQLAP